jgi:hypothetical protein
MRIGSRMDIAEAFFLRIYNFFSQKIYSTMHKL